MVTARDEYEDWCEGDEPYGDTENWWRRDDGSPALELVRPTGLMFDVVAPESFEAAQTIADRLRGGDPVLVELSGCDAELVGRLTDFCSGLVYALEGGLQHVGAALLFLTPPHLDLSGDEAADVRRPGFYNRR